MDNAMDVDDPNVHYVTPFLRYNCELAQTDDTTLAFLLKHLVDAVPNRSIDVPVEEINRLNMVDLRPLLVSGDFDKVAHTVLERVSSGPTAPAVTEGGRDAVVNAFRNTYRGSTVTLRKAIDQVINDGNLYANAIPFVQSSGTGKSRLMVELGQECFVLVLNLRKDDPTGSFSFPQPDRAVRQFLQDEELATNVDEFCRLRCAAFLCGVFFVLGDIFDAQVSTPSQFMEKLAKNRSAILEKTIQLSKGYYTLFRGSYKEAQREHEIVICSTITNGYISKQAKTFFSKLRKVNHSDRPPPFILALDEAQVMTTRGRGQSTSLNIFTSVLADLKQISPDWVTEIHFAAIFLSTNTQLNNLAPSKGQISSERSHSARLAGAFTCVPFDIFVERKKDWTVAEISTLTFISTFGRPLFGALIEAGLPASLALSLAEEKLAHAKQPFSLATLTNSQTAFALLSRRILLHFRPLQSSTTIMASNLIAHHLQVAQVVPKHRRFVISGSPSEPFIIEAAARMMATPDFSSIGCLLNLTNEELIDAGQSGEIVGRLLTIDAYDAALRLRSGSPIYHSWVPVLDFLKALFTDDVYKKIIDIRPYRDPEGKTLKEAFENAVIRLTHYVRLSQLSLFTAANVRKAFLRGMGLVGAESQTLLDILIAVLFVDLKKSPSNWNVEEAKMSHIMANWKNRADDATPPHSDPYETYPQLTSGLPTIFLWHQFGSKRSEVITPQAEKVHHPGRAVYFIDVYGIGQEVYRAITPANQPQYQQFVGCQDMFRDAPYTFQEYINDVEGTKPRWSAKSFEQTAG